MNLLSSSQIRITGIIFQFSLLLLSVLSCRNTADSRAPKTGQKQQKEKAAPVPRPGVDPTKEIFQPPIEMFSPEDSRNLIYLAEGYELEAILTEPEIKEPVAVAFDASGRMYVAEMRTYMQNIDGEGQKEPNSRISVHMDRDGDGRYDTHRVFADGLKLPRMMLTLKEGQLLVHETWDSKVVKYTDTDGDFSADQSTVAFELGPTKANLEHQSSGFLWAANNWIYMNHEFKTFRVRWTPDGFEQEAGNYKSKGQWGLTQDNYGKPWILSAGHELGPVNYQQPIEYGTFSIAKSTPENWRKVYPLCAVPDVQGGPPRLRENNTLNHFTSTCGQDVFRGDRLPRSLRGDLLFAEPVGRLIRRAEIRNRKGVTHLRNTYKKAEFLRATDPNFRPVNLQTAPDGTLYIVDMYRGIIQESQWVGKGSYLRKMVKKYGLQKNVGKGRIWRLRHHDFTPGPQPSMYDESSEKLVEHLDHPNGWWRDMAQRQLVLRQAVGVRDRLVEVIKTHSNHLARFHALWTLEGLGELEPKHILVLLEDEHPEVRRAAIRASETLFQKGRAGDRLRNRIRSVPDEDVTPGEVIQVMLTATRLNWSGTKSMVRSLSKEPGRSRGVQTIAEKLFERQSDHSK